MHDELVQKFNATQAVDAIISVKKTDNDTKTSETEKKITDHDHYIRYITKQEFN